MSKLLFNTHEEAMRKAIDYPESVYVIYPELACKIGVLPALILSTFDRVNKPIRRDSFKSLADEVTIRKSIRKLEGIGLIKKTPMSPKEICEIIKNKKFQGMGIGDKVCEWCGINTMVLHKHHYPKRKTRGGETANYICPNCHAEYHLMEGMLSYQVSEISGRLYGNQPVETESAADKPPRSGVNG